METIEVPNPNPELKDIPADQLEQIGEKIVYRLAQRPGSHVVLKYVRKMIKRRDTQTLHTAAMPVDRFLYHLPLYRQHQRLRQSGITQSRNTLTHLAGRTIDLLALWMH